MVDVRAAVEDDFLDAGLDGTLGNQLADSGSGCNVSAGLQRVAQFLVEGRSGSQGMALRVVDDLRVDVLRRAMHGQTRTLAGDLLDLTANARGAALDGVLGSHSSYSLPCKTRTAVCGSPALAGLPQPRLVALILLLLAVFAHDALAGVTHALALVRLGTAVLADLSRNLADNLLVDTGDDDFRRLRSRERDACGRLIDDFVAEAKRQLQVLALHGGAVTHAVDLEATLEAVLHAGQDVRDLSTGHAPLGTRILGVVARRNGDLAVIQLDQNFVIDDELQFAFRALRGDRLAVDRSGHAGGHLYGLLTNTRHVSVLVLLLFRRPIRRSGTAPR